MNILFVVVCVKELHDRNEELFVVFSSKNAISVIPINWFQMLIPSFLNCLIEKSFFTDVYLRI